MPIHCSISIRNLSAEEFETLDYRVMGHAYASQNELGRLCDECAYETDLKARLLADGFRSVKTQVPLTVTHGNFSKTYRLDLIADDALYELKTDTALVSEHETQLLNYLFLLGTPRGKLLNLRPMKVQGKLLATSLTLEKRREFRPNHTRWNDLTTECRSLRQTMLKLLEDWGAFLSASLYHEALVHLLGNATRIEHRVNLQRGELGLGTQRMFLHSPGMAFRVTGFTEGQDLVEPHLRRLLLLTDLKAIQWINLSHTNIEFTTITK